MRRRFRASERFRTVLFDRRGCGRHKPLEGLDASAAAHLVADIGRAAKHSPDRPPHLALQPA